MLWLWYRTSPGPVPLVCQCWSSALASTKSPSAIAGLVGLGTCCVETFVNDYVAHSVHSQRVAPQSAQHSASSTLCTNLKSACFTTLSWSLLLSSLKISLTTESLNVWSKDTGCGCGPQENYQLPVAVFVWFQTVWKFKVCTLLLTNTFAGKFSILDKDLLHFEVYMKLN